MCDINPLEELQSLFVCEHCGTCCRIGGNILMDEQDKERILAYLKEHPELCLDLKVQIVNVDPLFYLFVDSPPCPCLDPLSNMCKIYPARPSSCRSYPWLFMVECEGRLQDMFVCRGAVRSLGQYLDVEVF